MAADELYLFFRAVNDSVNQYGCKNVHFYSGRATKPANTHNPSLASIHIIFTLNLLLTLYIYSKSVTADTIA